MSTGAPCTATFSVIREHTLVKIIVTCSHSEAVAELGGLGGYFLSIGILELLYGVGHLDPMRHLGATSIHYVPCLLPAATSGISIDPILDDCSIIIDVMLLPRRRITSLSLLSIIIFTIWFFDYLPTFSEVGVKSATSRVKQKPTNNRLAPELATTEQISPERPIPEHVGSAKSSGQKLSTQAVSDQEPTPKIETSQPKPIAYPGKKAQYMFGARVFKEKYPLEEYRPLDQGLPLQLPQLQHNFEKESSETRRTRMTRLDAVKASFAHSWAGYKLHAWKKDELKPVDGGSVQTFGGWAATLVDTLDTLWIMDMKAEFKEAVEAVKGINFNTTEENTVNVFETTIRYLGGLLGAYDLSKDQEEYPVLLQKAIEVGDLLYCAFDTPNRMPVARWPWKEALEGAEQSASDQTLVAEIGSLTLEFTRLSQLTGDPKYFDAISRIMDQFRKIQGGTKLPGLWPVIIDAKTLSFSDNGFTLGGMADSLYEYLPKQHMLLGGRNDMYKEMYQFAITAAMNHIFFQPMVPDGADILISGSATVSDGSGIKSEPKGQHLGCYAGGMISIGAKIFRKPEHINMARKLVDGCIWAYNSMPTGIMPEVFEMLPCDMNSKCSWDEAKWHEAVLKTADRYTTDDEPTFKTDAERVNYTITQRRLRPGFVDITARPYLLRPEAIESVFIHYRLTGDADLPDKAWKMYEAIEKHTRTAFGNSAIDDVTTENPEKTNRMESFWMAETLKYFYLMFSEPDVVSLDDWVL